MGFDPIASVILGVTLFDETIAETPIGIVVTVLSLAAALAGVAILSRSQGAPPPKPLAGSAAPAAEGRAGAPPPETRHRSGTPRSCFVGARP